MEDELSGVHGILIPGGFGDRGIEGKINAVRIARTHRIPFFGICLGMQVAVIEFARNVGNFKRANSTEFDAKTPHPVISLLAEQKKVKNLGGTMRLGLVSVRNEARLHRRRRSMERRSINEPHRHSY